MTAEEQVAICKAIAVSCMWGQGGIASVILERMDSNGPAGPRGWTEVYREVQKPATRESLGVITERAELDRWLGRGYWLCNYDEDGCSLFNPPPMNGLSQYVSKELAYTVKAERERSFELYSQAAERFWTKSMSGV